MRELGERDKGDDVDHDLLPAIEIETQEDTQQGRFTDLGTIPPVVQDDLDERLSASDLAFDDELDGHDQEHGEESPFHFQIASAAPKGRTKPTFKTLSGKRVEKTDKTEAIMLNAIRKSPIRLSPIWLEQAQVKLGADATGAMNTDTLRAMQNHATQQGIKLDVAKLLSTTFLSTIVAGDPFAVPDQAWEKTDTKDAAATQNADVCAQEVGYASYKDYAADFVEDVKFLGVTLADGKSESRAHRFLVDRLKVAEQFLIQHHGSQEEAVKKTGVAGGLSYEFDASSRKAGKAHQHTMGLAIDINPSQNPWIYRGGKDANARYDFHFALAAKLFQGPAVTSGSMNYWSATQSTEELHATMDTASNAFAKYLSFSKQPVDDIQKVIEEKVEKDPTKAKEIADKIAAFPAWFHSRGGQTNTKELTNVDMSLLVALRDVAGLNWGGTEMSLNENGDFMHFDCRNTDFGGQISKKAGELAAVDAAKAKREAEKKKAAETK